MNPQVDNYLIEGCGRCKYGGTPQCKVNNWQEELKLLRELALECGLTEELKWGVPCYTYQHANIAIVAAFKAYCSVSFFKGSLLQDPDELLTSPGDNSQATRQIRISGVDEIIAQAAAIKAFLLEAIEIEKAGLKVKFKKISEQDIPEEFQTKLDEIPALKEAFHALTPGRQRAYLLHFSQAKQSKTREARIEKYIPQILAGKGFNDR